MKPTHLTTKIITPIVVIHFFLIQPSCFAAAPLKPLYGPQKCNGKAEFCNRRYNEITQLRVHNATSITKDKLLGILPNFVADQHRDIDEQLFKDGLRVFKLPIHKKGTEEIAWVTHALSLNEFDRYAQQYPFIKPFRNKLYALDASNKSLKDVLSIVKLFLDQHKNEVVTLGLDIQGNNMGDLIAQAFIEAKIDPYLYGQEPSKPWPTLAELIAMNKRLIVFTSDFLRMPKTKEKYPAFESLFNYGPKFIFENVFSFKSVKALNSETCDIVRYKENLSIAKIAPTNKIFDMTHFVTPGAAGDAEMARQVNSYDSVKNHVERCLKKTGGLYPNFISVDFYDENFDDLKKIVDEINAARMQ